MFPAMTDTELRYLLNINAMQIANIIEMIMRILVFTVCFTSFLQECLCACLNMQLNIYSFLSVYTCGFCDYR